MYRSNTFETVVTKDGREMDRIRVDNLPDLIRRVFDTKLRKSIPASEMNEANSREIDNAIRMMDGNSSFFNRHTADRIERMIEEPRTDLMEAVDVYRDRISELMPPDAAPRRRMRRGQEYGDTVDIDRELCGILECWDRSERIRTAQRQVTVAVNLSFPGRTTERDLLPRGGLAVAMVSQLIRRGIDVELVAVNASDRVTDRGRRELVEIVVKQSSEVIDEATIATMCCDVGFIRAAMYCGSFTLNPDVVQSGWGRACNVSEIAAVCDEVRYDYVIDGSVTTVEEGVRAINELIEKAK